jgi:ABC-2 type transport system permease protein
MKKAWIVARHEFRVTVKRAWFVVATFVFPLVFLGIGVGMWLLGRHVVEESRARVREKPLGIVDGWGGLTKAPAGFEIRRLPDETAARAALKAGEVGVCAILPPDYLATGRVTLVSMRRPTLFTSDRPPLPEGFDRWLIANILQEVDAPRVGRAQAPIVPVSVTLDSSGTPSAEDPREVQRRTVVAYAFLMLLFTSVFSSSAYLLQGMAEEKENRVMEIVLSSATPGELMLGKLVGLGAAGLLQLLIWSLMGIAGVALLVQEVVLAPVTFAYSLLFFLLGYVLYGSLMLGFGALGTNFRESQQMASMWSLIGTSPFFIHFALVEAPHGALARVFSLIPFTAPTTMIFRFALDPKGTPVLDIALSAAILLASTWFAVKISARLYRAGLLLYGKRPGLREIWRWLRAAA